MEDKTKMIVRLKIPLLFSLLILCYVLFSYSFLKGWWNSSIGSILVIFLSYLIWKEDFLKQTGLHLNLITIAKSLVLAIIIAACSLLIMKYIGNKNNIQITYHNTWRGYYHFIFNVLNEEVVLGAILLFTLVNKLRIRPLVASLSLALFFSLIHFIFYKWIFLDRGILGITTLITLLLVGFVRNSLIVQTDHIGYSWALHFGWIAMMFGSMHIDNNTNLILSEPESFNLFLGSAEMLIISLIMAGSFLVYWIRKQNLNTTN